METELRIRKKDNMVTADLLNNEGKVAFYFFRNASNYWCVASDPVEGEYNDIDADDPHIVELNEILTTVTKEEEFEQKILNSDKHPFLVHASLKT